MKISQLSLFDEETDGYSIRQIESKDTHWLLLNIHYAKRIPSISFAYGLFVDTELVGAVTYGKPASPALCRGICGESFSKDVLELNRLVLVNNKKNEASRLVAGSFRLLPKPKIIVSYADTAQGHEGIVYHATNFVYTGLSDRHKEWRVKGMEHLHSRALFHTANSVSELRIMYGDALYQVERSRKHRYIMFLGNKKEKKAMMSNLKYQVLPYPKEIPV